MNAVPALIATALALAPFAAAAEENAETDPLRWFRALGHGGIIPPRHRRALVGVVLVECRRLFPFSYLLARVDGWERWQG